MWDGAHSARGSLVAREDTGGWHRLKTSEHGDKASVMLIQGKQGPSLFTTLELLKEGEAVAQEN